MCKNANNKNDKTIKWRLSWPQYRNSFMYEYSTIIKSTIVL